MSLLSIPLPEGAASRTVAPESMGEHHREVASTRGLCLADFGTDRRVALRRLVHAIRDRGWRDEGDAALAVVRLLADERGVAPSVLARSVPAEFRVRNRITSKELERFLLEFADPPR
jgi:hypothetical protein